MTLPEKWSAGQVRAQAHVYAIYSLVAHSADLPALRKLTSQQRHAVRALIGLAWLEGRSDGILSMKEVDEICSKRR